MGKFEDNLWEAVVDRRGDELSREVTAGTHGSRTPSRLLAGTTAAGLAASAAVVTLLLSATTSPPAFAVTRHHDGSVTVQINRRSGIAGANRTLAGMGIHARMKVASQDQWFSGKCTVMPGAKPNLSAMRADAAQYAAAGNASAAQALSEGADQIANGTLPDVVYNCTGSFSGSGNSAQVTPAPVTAPASAKARAAARIRAER